MENIMKVMIAVRHVNEPVHAAADRPQERQHCVMCLTQRLSIV